MKPTATNIKSPEVPLVSSCKDTVLTRILSRLLFPLARLCLAHGVSFSAVEELLKQAFVQEANALQPGAPGHGSVSRISTATGLTRREVARLLTSDAQVRSSKPPIASEIFAHWTTNPAYQDRGGAPSVLRRQGPAPSFEALAQVITRDIHPRSMLDELIRLGLAQYDEKLDSISLTRNEFVPISDAQQILDLLGDNVGDHLTAAVHNVLHDGGRHLEQAVFADELSTESLKALRPLFAARWTALRDAMVPVITELIESDRLAGRIQDRRIRIGLYTFDECTSNSDTSILHEPEKLPRRKYYSKDSKK